MKTRRKDFMMAAHRFSVVMDDSATEAILLKRLASEYRGRKTILMITHRECALTYADEILRLD